MKTIKFKTALTALFFIIISGKAQTQSNVQVNTIRPLQISFISPMGTNGTDSWRISNNFSLNIFAGYNGGVEGCEISGFYNVIKGNVNGLQIGGFGNTNMGSVNGCQIAGFSNVSKLKVRGLQLAGFTNVVTDSCDGGQISGFANVVKGTSSGLQLSGFTNVSEGMPVGAQITGFANVNRGDANGLQIAGFANVNDGDIQGVQISGFVNITRKLTGSQIGFINIADTVENGIALGFLSIVKKGYRTFEISGNESLFAVASFKTGTEKFYNILSVGSRLESNFISWGWGYGIGTLIPVNEKIKLNLDAVAYHINRDEWWTGHLNMLNKIDLCAAMQLSEKFSVFGGITWNIHISDIHDDEGYPVNSSLVSWHSYDKTRRNTNVKMYPGFKAGIRF